MIHNLIIVGAGPAGIGMGLELKKRGVDAVRIVDQRGIGAAFEAWPRETRLITPSFPAHAYGCADLNAIDLQSSPGAMLGVDHLNGHQYAQYLKEMARKHDLQVDAPVQVRSLSRQEGHWELETTQGLLQARCVVWAVGEFGSPRTEGIPGLENCIHYADVTSWDQRGGEQFVVLGGGESGIDSACNLISRGKVVIVLDRDPSWETCEGDPSLTLSPVTVERLRKAKTSGRLFLESGVELKSIEAVSNGYRAVVAGDRFYECDGLPINCLGFYGAPAQIPELWEWNDGDIVLSPNDESTKYPGLFLVGPQVRQPDEIFCFIYKFRTRFPRVADAIQTHLAQTSAPAIS